jgi:putative phage-type endonuclease
MFQSEEIKNDIHNLCEECFTNNIPIHLDELTHYITDTLIDKYTNKLIYSEYVRQLIAELYPIKFGHYYQHFKTADLSLQVKKLQSLPQAPQRSEEWFKLKQDTIGASESAVVFNANPYETLNSFILKKCHHPDFQFKGGIHCQHGIKYEPIIQQLYTSKTGEDLLEFGSIIHPKINFISASPDGITKKGVMIEIKAPPKRVITGIPPIYYWYQMQQQLQVCGLKKVDFVECKIEEYDSYSDFVNDDSVTDGSVTDGSVTDGSEKGVIIEYSVDDRIDYIYPDKLLSSKEVEKWMLEYEQILPDGVIFNRFIYWKVVTYCVTEVWRDDVWWNKYNYKYYEIWDTIKYYRNNDITELLPKKRVKKDSSN